LVDSPINVPILKSTHDKFWDFTQLEINTNAKRNSTLIFSV
jgi:hypothetical protein